MRKLITLTLSLMSILLFLSACGGQSEGNAKKTVNSYLSLMKKGDTYEASKLLDGNDSLIDVFNYKYLDTIREEDMPFELKVLRTEFEEGHILKNKYETWENYQEEIKLLYRCEKCEVIVDDYHIHTLNRGNTHKKYTLLYDTEIANGLGGKLYKKVEFDVEWDVAYDKFKITNINIR